MSTCPLLLRDTAQAARCPALVLSDVDRTLLRHDHTLPDAVARAGKTLPVPLVLASARSPIGMAATHSAMAAHPLAICFNGAWVGDLDTGATLLHQPLDLTTAREAFQAARELGAAPGWFLRDHVLALSADIDRLASRLAVTGDPVSRHDDFSALAVTPPMKLLLCADSDRIDGIVVELANRFRGQVAVTRSGPSLIEVVSFEVSKGAAARAVVAHLGVPLAGLAAAGDAANDIEMLRMAAIALAPSNAAAEVLALADVVTPDCDTGGMAVGLRWLAQRPKT